MQVLYQLSYGPKSLTWQWLQSISSNVTIILHYSNIPNRSSEDDILDQLQRLTIEPNAGKLRKIDSVATARAIVADEDRIYWSLGKHVVKGKTKTGTNAPLWLLIKDGFFFDPAPTPVPNRSKFLLSQLTSPKLKIEAKSRNLDPTGLLKTELVELLSSK